MKLAGHGQLVFECLFSARCPTRSHGHGQVEGGIKKGRLLIVNRMSMEIGAIGVSTYRAILD